ncbi:MAG TPA: bifunctional DNA-formamidopyrimidine glycosylase/DNA-(apurinic or apyrimidinic site) lyase [Bryobacteraceae bacterium]|nr:bifunctional DNA-formamidopyrimidine glycosylase/DNA-(apurinic or apyrimidinic site) lyase [Bryobacteraceae bacterium]
MPELPEVETVVRTLAPYLLGRRIVSARFTSRFVTPGNRAKLARQVAGRKIESVARRGKFIVVALDQGNLVMHLGMTGKLLTSGVETTHTYGVFTLDDGVLLYEDPRQFGRIEWGDARVKKLGPEPMVIGLPEFSARLKTRKTRIKALLLNQAFLAGLGNIYVDEILFSSGIHPLAQASRLSAARVAKLHQAMVETLTLAIQHRGSSISDYVDADGNRGDFQMLHRVYGREGEPCVNCGTPIKKVVVAGRGTHYCPVCQKR